MYTRCSSPRTWPFTRDSPRQSLLHSSLLTHSPTWPTYCIDSTLGIPCVPYTPSHQLPILTLTTTIPFMYTYIYFINLLITFFSFLIIKIVIYTLMTIGYIPIYHAQEHKFGGATRNFTSWNWNYVGVKMQNNCWMRGMTG